MQHLGDADNWALRKTIDSWRDAKELLGLYENITGYYAYLILESKVKSLRKPMKIISECIIYSLSLNPGDLDKFKQFKYENCV